VGEVYIGTVLDIALAVADDRERVCLLKEVRWMSAAHAELSTLVDGGTTLEDKMKAKHQLRCTVDHLPTALIRDPMRTLPGGNT